MEPVHAPCKYSLTRDHMITGGGEADRPTLEILYDKYIFLECLRDKWMSRLIFGIYSTRLYFKKNGRG